MARLLALIALAALTIGLAPAPAAAQSDQRCFPETGHCISGRIREYWEQNGGLPVFGFPTGPQQETLIEGRPVQAQWFERNRLELHPQNARPYDVLLGRLGVDRLSQQARDWNSFRRAGSGGSGAVIPAPDCRTFPETGFRVCGEFLAYFSGHGLSFPGQPGVSYQESLALFGLPVSEAITERLSDGREYTVQWFERARLESHPENRRPYHVLLGLLGNEISRPEPRGCALDVLTALRYPYEQAPFRAAMGCPHPGREAAPAAMQYFERGMMIWLDGIPGTGNGPTIVVITYGKGPNYQLFADTWAPGSAENSDVAPAGLYTPVRGFGKVWRESPGLRQYIGWATSAEQATSASYQYFDFGAVVFPRALPAQPAFYTRAALVFGPAGTDVVTISY